MAAGQLPPCMQVSDGQNNSLALLEMRLVLSKMLWVYDMQLMNPNLDWDRDNMCYMLWDKPDLMVKYTRRSGIFVPSVDL